ncbi:B-cell receptor CD22-like isoform X3 [Takifugu rubripes]|uniref:B-cell receptor CD22-like isoform X3 n=1 Tax=Takifugu rubripes TaxID=31033 RepID=UPI001145216A|nr:B-cell receptor CD22-like isoform X3 [Takifugu rubripes]
MFSTKLGFAVVGFILNSGVLGKGSHICALKGTSLNLSCSAKHSTIPKWFKLVGTNWTEVLVNGSRLKHQISKDTHPTLSFMGLTKDDKTSYCCNEKPENCHEDHINLTVTALQVKVFNTTDGQTVTLMCSTTCTLTDRPAAYIWYRNSEILYQDRSPWYQEMVTSDKTVRYSCAIKGYEALRAPAVTVEWVSSTCFTVSYNDGRMCLHNHTSVKGPCSITYPTEIHVEKTPGKDYVKLSCNTSCPHTTTQWYKNREMHQDPLPPIPNTSQDNFLCAVSGVKELQSEEVCAADKSCLTVNYIKKRICALEGSSVNISSKYSSSKYTKSKAKHWSRIIWNGEKEERMNVLKTDHFTYHEDQEKQINTLSIKSVKKSDSAEYRFMHQDDNTSQKPGTVLIVTDIKVKISPSTEVTEGDRVKLTCSTSCPLTNNKNYIWYLNDQLLQLPEHQNKHLVLDVVTPQHAGNYSCAVNTQRDVRSPEKTLRVQSSSLKWTLTAAAGVGAALLVFTSLVICCIRGKGKLSQNTVLKLQEVNHGPVYEEITDQPTEENGIYYSSIRFPQTDVDPLDSMVQPHQHQQEQHIPYAVVCLRNRCT